MPWTAAQQASLSSTISWSSVKLMSIESVIPSKHIILCHPLCPQSFLASGSFPVSRLFYKVAKVLELQRQSFQWIFRVDFHYDWLVWSPCCPGNSQESSPAPQFESINSSALSLLYSPTLTSMTTGKTIALTLWTFVGKVTSLLFNTLSRFVIAIPNFMAAIMNDSYNNHAIEEPRL